MPDTLICYAGSIEKLKLLGATYLLTKKMSVRANFGRNFFSRNVFFEKNL
jgi:hypothetical protein